MRIGGRITGFRTGQQDKKAAEAETPAENPNSMAVESALDRTVAFPVLALGGLYGQPEFLAQGATDESPNRVRLPARRFHQGNGKKAKLCGRTRRSPDCLHRREAVKKSKKTGTDSPFRAGQLRIFKRLRGAKNVSGPGFSIFSLLPCGWAGRS